MATLACDYCGTIRCYSGDERLNGNLPDGNSLYFTQKRDSKTSAQGCHMSIMVLMPMQSKLSQLL